MTSNYLPDNGSPFALAYSLWITEGEMSLAVYAVEELDEFASCASSLRNRPCYAGDERLAQFETDCDRNVSRKIAS